MKITESMANDLGIRQYISESEQSYFGRIILSALSKWMLTACFSESGEASVESIKAISAEKLSLLRDSLSLGSISTLGTGAFEDIIDYIYTILRDNGAFYHKAYHVIAREKKLISLGQASIIQGLQPEEQCIFSGLAPISLQRGAECNLDEMFDLPDMHMDDIVKMVWRKSIPVESSVRVAEYLKFDNLKKGYYSPFRTDHNQFSMGRTMHAGAGYERYIMYGNETRRIPDDYITGGWHEYCRLAIINDTTHQCAYIKHNSTAMTIKFDYKLPAKDLRFIRYIAWPVSLALLDSPFEFTIHPTMWPVIKKRLQYLNYKVVQK